MTSRRRPGGRSARLSGIFAADEQVFRFHPDGTVLDVLIKPAPGPEDAALLAGWLRREAPVRGVHTAHYELRGPRLSFTSHSHLRDEDVEVVGTWARGQLSLALSGRGWTLLARPFVRIGDGRAAPSAGQGRRRTG